MLDHFRFLADHTRLTPKMTIPSPSVLHFRGGRRAVDPARLPGHGGLLRRSRRRRTAARSRRSPSAGCRYLQLDEVNLAYLCDPEQRRMLSDRGDDPDRLPAIYAAHDQHRHLRPSGGHGHHHASLPRQFPLQLDRAGRLRAGGRTALQPDRRGRLFHGVRHRTRRRLRTAALRAQGQDRGAWPGHLQDGALEPAEELERRIDEPPRNTWTSTSFASARSAASPAPRRATCLTEEEQWAKLARIVQVARNVWGE